MRIVNLVAATAMFVVSALLASQALAQTATPGNGAAKAAPKSAAQELLSKAVVPPAEIYSDSPERRPLGVRLGDQVDLVGIEGVPAKTAFEWWSRTTHIPLIIDWESLQRDGVDPQRQIDIKIRRVPAAELLTMIMKQVQAPDQALLYQSTSWYVEVLTKRLANQRCVVKVYDVRDLLHLPRRFADPPDFDLNTALSSSGGRSGGRGQSNMGTGQSNSATPQPPVKTEEERAEDLMNLLRDTVEPTIWKERGGEFASMRYYNGQLIVNAPLYVHAQIGMPVPPVRSPVFVSPAGGGNGGVGPAAAMQAVGHLPIPRSNGVAGVATPEVSKVSGVSPP